MFYNRFEHHKFYGIKSILSIFQHKDGILCKNRTRLKHSTMPISCAGRSLHLALSANHENINVGNVEEQEQMSVREREVKL